MKSSGLLFAWLTLVIIMPQPARASRPSPEDLAQNQARQAHMEKAQAMAAPWRDSLAAAFAGISDSTARDEAVRLVFLTTYKHYVPTTDKSGSAAFTAAAKTFAAAWVTLTAKCRAANLEPLEAAEAIYRFTNSDWAPVSAATGPGLDKVKTAKDYLVWTRAVIAAGKKALAAKADPTDVWSRQAASLSVHHPADLAKVGIFPPQPRY